MIDPTWFAGRLRELRLAAGLSQPALAERAGMAKDALARLERGESDPKWATVCALAGALKVDVGEFAREPSPVPEPQRGRPRKTPVEKKAGRPHKAEGKKGK